MNNFNLTLRSLWDDVQSSLWFRPSVISLFAIFLAIIAPFVDQSTKLKFYVIGADNARAVLTTIASSMLTVVTLTFSILMVALTLASQQFSPRVLRSFTSNHTAQNILGILIGAFLYSLLVLVTVIDTSDTTFVPLLSVLIAIGYAIVAIAAFIYFIDHIAKSIRVSYIIHTINAETVALLHNVELEQVVGHQANVPLSDPIRDRAAAATIKARHAGYIQAIDVQQLAELAETHGYVVQIVGMTGDFVAMGRPLLYVWQQDSGEKEDIQKTDRMALAHGGDQALKNAADPPFKIPRLIKLEMSQQFDIGVERTMFEDVLFGIRQLVDIALKALSPGVNDPTTAINCLHYLENILIQAVKRPDRSISYYNEGGQLCLLGRTVTFGAILDLAFHQLRYYGCTDPTVAEQLLQILIHLAEETDVAERQNQLWLHAELIRHHVDERIDQQHDRERINHQLFQLAKLVEREYSTIALTTSVETESA